jgi:V/A-type H+/Na+-transporting ATPase subunit E
MEVKLESLIEKIKSEGVEGAQKESQEIVDKGKQEAAEIVAKANKDAEELVAKAEAKAQQFQVNSELAIQQAARDGELLFKGKITDLFDAVFKRTVNSTLAPDFMKEMILKIVDEWKGSDVEVTVNDADQSNLEQVLFAGLAEDVKKGITIKPSSNVAGGFQIGVKEENVYYDFSDDSIAAILKSFLNTRLQEILGKKNG